MRVPTPADLRWLDAAARLAMPYRGTTAENPTVGAIVVSPKGIVLGRGVTAQGGRPHAEPHALGQAGTAARGATLYVTLEPCNHWGRTPPCADAVLASGVARVVCGAVDPDPRTAGQSLQRLVQAGVEVAVGEGIASIEGLHEGFFMRQRMGRPFVTAKLAVSRDGKIGLGDRGNVAITGEAARRWTHMQRALSDAIMVGAQTARLDQPRLNVRLEGLELRTPIRVLLGNVSGASALNQMPSISGQDTVFIVASGYADSLSQLADTLKVPSVGGRLDLPLALSGLAQRGVSRLFVEGGATLNDALLNAGLVDRFHLLESDVTVGPSGIEATVHASLPQRLTELGFRLVESRPLGCDMLTTYERV